MRTVFLLGLLSLATLQALAAGETPAATGGPFAAVRAEKVTIDGKLDEACWQNSVPARGDYIHGKTSTLSEAPRATVRYAWDNDYLYIGYETFDANLLAFPNGEMQGPPGRRRAGARIYGDEGDRPDIIEFFIAVDDPHYMWEIHHNAANQFNDVWCVVIPDERPFRTSIETPWGIRFCHNEYLLDDGDAKVARAVALKPKADGTPSTVNEEGDTDTGYTGEIRVPWRSLSVPRSWGFWADAAGNRVDRYYQGDKFWVWRPAGKTIRLFMVVQDTGLETRYHHASPTMPGGWFHHSYTYWPVYVLAP